MPSAKRKEINNMSFEEVLIKELQRNTAVESNSLYELNIKLKEISRSLQLIGNEIKKINMHLDNKKE